MKEAKEKANRERRRRFRHAADVLLVLVERDLKMLYKRSALGLVWAIANPVLQLLIFSFLFRRVISLQIPNYPVYLFIGVLSWGWFHSSLSESVSLITGGRALVRQPGFPLTLLPHVTVAVRFFHFLLAVPILLFLLWANQLYPTTAWLSVPLIAVIQFALTVGLAYPLAALNVRLRDTQHIVRVLLQLGMYLTPVFYSADRVPESARWLYELNPMVWLLGAWRSVLIDGRWPDPASISVLAALAVVLLWSGRRLFVAQSHRFVEEL